MRGNFRAIIEIGENTEKAKPENGEAKIGMDGLSARHKKIGSATNTHNHGYVSAGPAPPGRDSGRTRMKKARNIIPQVFGISEE